MLHYCFETELSEMPGVLHGHGIKKHFLNIEKNWIFFGPILPIFICKSKDFYHKNIICFSNAYIMTIDKDRLRIRRYFSS